MEEGRKRGRYDTHILVRMEMALREELERLAIAEDLPVSTLCRRLLRQAVDARKSSKRLPKR